MRVSAPVPACVSEPAPETTPPKVTALERLKISAPLLVTLPTMLPVVPPAPSANVAPVLMVVPPV